MNYGRETFDRAMQGLQGFDNRYATAFQNALAGDNPSLVRQFASQYIGGPLKPPAVMFDKDAGIFERIGGRTYQATAPVVRGIARYGIPAAGVTAAGMGLMELADRMNQQTESTLSVQ